MLRPPQVTLSRTAGQTNPVTKIVPALVLHQSICCECCMSAAVTAVVLLSSIANEQGLTACWKANSRQHADVFGLTVLPGCQHLGQLPATMLGSLTAQLG